MGLLDRMSRRSLRGEPVHLPPGEPVEVKGEASYQRALSEICGGKCEQGHSLPVQAELAPEPDNAYDPNAVKVIVGRRLVGYLSRANALAYRDAMQHLVRTGRTGTCAATVVGGWRRGTDDEGMFGIWLDLAAPDVLRRHLEDGGS
jgi:hypothetical protein